MYESKCVSQRHLSYAHAVKKADKEDKAKLLDKVDAFIFDCDGENPYMQYYGQRVHHRAFISEQGRCAQHACASVGVIWRGDSLIDGVPETLDALRAMVSLPPPSSKYLLAYPILLQRALLNTLWDVWMHASTLIAQVR